MSFGKDSRLKTSSTEATMKNETAIRMFQANRLSCSFLGLDISLPAVGLSTGSDTSSCRAFLHVRVITLKRDYSKYENAVSIRGEQ
jgi:hypothetical protein